jgi:hypothetical protein
MLEAKPGRREGTIEGDRKQDLGPREPGAVHLRRRPAASIAKHAACIFRALSGFEAEAA